MMTMNFLVAKRTRFDFLTDSSRRQDTVVIILFVFVEETINYLGHMFSDSVRCFVDHCRFPPRPSFLISDLSSEAPLSFTAKTETFFSNGKGRDRQVPSSSVATAIATTIMSLSLTTGSRGRPPDVPSPVLRYLSPVSSPQKSQTDRLIDNYISRGDRTGSPFHTARQGDSRSPDRASTTQNYDEILHILPRSRAASPPINSTRNRLLVAAQAVEERHKYLTDTKQSHLQLENLVAEAELALEREKMQDLQSKFSDLTRALNVYAGIPNNPETECLGTGTSAVGAGGVIGRQGLGGQLDEHLLTLGDSLQRAKELPREFGAHLATIEQAAGQAMKEAFRTHEEQLVAKIRELQTTAEKLEKESDEARWDEFSGSRLDCFWQNIAFYHVSVILDDYKKKFPQSCFSQEISRRYCSQIKAVSNSCGVTGKCLEINDEHSHLLRDTTSETILFLVQVPPRADRECRG